jgi:hypothetical protein
MHAVRMSCAVTGRARRSWSITQTAAVVAPSAEAERSVAAVRANHRWRAATVNARREKRAATVSARARCTFSRVAVTVVSPEKLASVACVPVRVMRRRQREQMCQTSATLISGKPQEPFFLPGTPSTSLIWWKSGIKVKSYCRKAARVHFGRQPSILLTRDLPVS